MPTALLVVTILLGGCGDDDVTDDPDGRGDMEQRQPDAGGSGGQEGGSPGDGESGGDSDGGSGG